MKMPIGKTAVGTGTSWEMSPRWTVDSGKSLRRRRGSGKTVVAGDA